MSKFRVGDRVKIIDNSYGAPIGSKGQVGEVIVVELVEGVSSNDYDIKVLVELRDWWFKEDDLQLHEPKSLGQLLKEAAQKNKEKSVSEVVSEPLKEYEQNFTGNPVLVPNEAGGVKFDLGKKDYTILLQDLKVTVDEVTDVLEIGAKKYARGNYKLIESERYHKALLRHIMSYLSGELNDPETGKHHLAHAICCAAFLIEREVKKGDK